MFQKQRSNIGFVFDVLPVKPVSPACGHYADKLHHHKRSHNKPRRFNSQLHARAFGLE